MIVLSHPLILVDIDEDVCCRVVELKLLSGNCILVQFTQQFFQLLFALGNITYIPPLVYLCPNWSIMDVFTDKVCFQFFLHDCFLMCQYARR